ncbi:MAG: hypothetical protein K6G00_03475 [Treponema sp.]|nr:hypothetical protein [Treponema sp.]
MIKNFINISLTLFLFYASLSFISCEKLQSKTKENADEIVEAASVTEEIKYNPEDGLICILFGEDFTAEPFYNEAIAKLTEKYGLSEEGGIIFPVKYPDDVKSRISNLYDIITEHKIRGIILLGAPEGTHKALYRLRSNSSEEGKVLYSNAIFSLMPQDDILGQESTCDFILEYERSTSDTDLEQEISITPQLAETAENIVIRAVRYIEENPEPLLPTAELREHVQAIVGAKKVRRYTDPETGLQAINHFVIEQ